MLTLLSQYVAGIDPLTPGYDRVAIKPRLGGLRFADARVVTPRGVLRARTQRTPEGTVVELTVPAGVECVVSTPGESSAQIVGAGEHRVLLD